MFQQIKNYHLTNDSLIDIPLRTVLLFILFYSIQINLHAQVNIKGASCVIPGIKYHYIVQAKWDSSSTMQACITGGNFNDGNNCSPSGVITSSLFVIWNSASGGSINVNSSLGLASIQVTTTTELIGGQINTGDLEQTFITGSGPYVFHCSAATGGSCTASYQYKWQESTDMQKWVAIKDAKSQNLIFADSIHANTFFRRIVTDIASNTIAYSNIGQLSIIIPILPGDSLYNASSAIQSNINDNYLMNTYMIAKSGKINDTISEHCVMEENKNAGLINELK